MKPRVISQSEYAALSSAFHRAEVHYSLLCEAAYEASRKLDVCGIFGTSGSFWKAIQNKKSLGDFIKDTQIQIADLEQMTKAEYLRERQETKLVAQAIERITGRKLGVVRKTRRSL